MAVITDSNGKPRYGLSFGGVYLLCPNAALISAVEQLSTIELVPEFDTNSWHNNLDHLLVKTPDLMPDKIQIGKLKWPTGASNFAYAHFIISSDQAASIALQTPTVTGPAALNLRMGVQLGLNTDISTTYKGIAPLMYALPVRPLAGVPGANGAMLLTLVDARWFWWQQYANIVVDEGTTTWSSLLSDIFSALGITVTVDTINANYQLPTARFNADGQPLPILLDAVLRQIGQRFVAGIDGTYYTQNYTTAALATASIPASGWNLKSGGTFSATELNRIVPDSITVQFSRTDSGIPGTTSYEVNVPLTSLSLPEFTGVTGYPAEEIIVADLTAEFVLPTDVTPTNNTAVTAVATQTATDWYLWQLGNFSITYINILPVTPNGLFEYVEWDYSKEYDGDISGGYTRIQRATWNDRVWGQVTTTQNSPFPPTPVETLIKIVDQTANANGYYPAKTVILNPVTNTYVIDADCWAWDENNLPLIENSVYTGFFTAVNSSDGLEIYSIRTPDATVTVTSSAANSDGFWEAEFEVINATTGALTPYGQPCYCIETNGFNLIQNRTYNGRLSALFEPTHSDTISFTQPAVGANVTVTLTTPPVWIGLVGLRVKLTPQGGFYDVVSLSGTSWTIKNLGTTGNTAVGSPVTATTVVPANGIPIFNLQMIGVRAQKNTASTTGPRTIVNLIEGSNISITKADNAGNDSSDFTITNTYSFTLTNSTGTFAISATSPISPVTEMRFYSTQFQLTNLGGGIAGISIIGSAIFTLTVANGTFAISNVTPISPVSQLKFDSTYFTTTDLTSGVAGISLLPSAIFTLTVSNASFVISPAAPISPVTDIRFHPSYFQTTNLGGGVAGISAITSAFFPTCTLPLAIAAGNISITNENQDLSTPGWSVLWNNFVNDGTAVTQWTTGPQTHFFIVGVPNGTAGAFTGYVQFNNTTNTHDVAINAPLPSTTYTLSLPNAEPTTNFQKLGLDAANTAAGNPYLQWRLTEVQAVSASNVTSGAIEWDTVIGFASDLFVVTQAAANDGKPIIDLFNGTQYSVLQPSITGARPGWTTTPQIGVSVSIGVPSTTTGALELANAGSANTTSIEAGATAVSGLTFILPITVPGAGQILTATSVASPNVTLGWTSPLTNPMTTEGDIIYENATPAPARLGGNTASTHRYLQSLGSLGAATAPTWSQVDLTDGVTGILPTANGGLGIAWPGGSPTGSYPFWNGSSFAVGGIQAGTGISVSLGASSYIIAVDGTVVTAITGTGISAVVSGNTATVSLGAITPTTVNGMHIDTSLGLHFNGSSPFTSLGVVAGNAVTFNGSTNFSSDSGANASFGAGFSITTGKSVSFSNSLTIAGTDGSTLNVGAGGTLAAMAFVSSVTLTGDVTGSGTSSIATTLANTAVTPGTYTAATITVDSKGRITSASSNSILSNPMTALGDIIYGGSSPAGTPTRLAGDTSNTRKFLRTLSVTGTATAPVWDTIISSDLPTITLTGDATGAASGGSIATTVAKINGATLGTTTATSAHILVADGSAWQSVAMSSDATIATSGALTLANSGVTAGTYYQGNVTFDAKGRATAATSASVVVLQDQQTSGTNGGASTSGSWVTRTLNTKVVDTNSICTLSSNQFQLPAGTYEINASAPAFGANRHQIRLQNITDTATVAPGTSEFADSTNTTQTRSHINTVFTIAGTKTFEIQHQVQTAKTTNGFGVAAGGGFTVTNEVYTSVKIERIG